MADSTASPARSLAISNVRLTPVKGPDGTPPETQIVQGKSVCVVSCQRSPEPVFLKWKGMEGDASGDFYVRSGPGTVRLAPGSAVTYIQSRFPG